MEIYIKNIFYFHNFSFFLVFKHDFIRCVDFIRIADLNTASGDVTNYVTHRILNTNLYILVVEIDEKFSLNDRF